MRILRLVGSGATMPNDAYTLSFLANELKTELTGGKVNKITQGESDEITFYIYSQNKTYKLLISANSSLPRIHFTESVKENPLTSFNFLMNLRKHLSGAKIQNISAAACERIITIEFLSKSDLKDEEVLKLYVELMGKHSNIILTDAFNKILSAVKTVSLDVNTSRRIFPGLIYQFPKTHDNFCLNEEDKIKDSLLNYNESDLEKFLCKTLRGISSLTAKEIICLSKIKNGENLTKAGVESLIKTITEFYDKSKNNASAPCIIYGKSADVFPFAYRNVLGEIENYDSLNSAFAALYDKKDNIKRMEEKSKQLRQVINGNINKLNKKTALLKERLNECSKKEEYRICGELITSNIYKVKPGGEVLVCQNYYDDNKEISIKLDKTLSPSKNAQSYYKKYNKLKTAEKYAAEQLRQSEELLEYFLSVDHSLNKCGDVSEINEILEELKKEGVMPDKTKSKSNKAKEPQYKFISYKIGGFNIYAGKNNLQNDCLTFKTAKSNDIWLHAKDTHGAHVIIACDNKPVPDGVLIKAAQIAAYFSKAKENQKTAVDYTFKKYVKKPSGSRPGFVIYTDNKTVMVEPDENLKYKINQTMHSD